MEFPMNLTIRARLTLYFTAIFGTIVAVLAIGCYLFIRRDLYSKLDSALQVQVEVTATSASHELTEHQQEASGDADIQSVLNDQEHTGRAHTQILVMQGNRTVAYKRSGFKTPDIRTMPLDKIKSADTYQGVRFAKGQLEVPEFHTTYQIYSAESLDETRAQLWQVEREMMLFVPLGLALAAWAGYLTARRALAPLKELTDRIGGITTTGLSDRISVKHQEDEIGRLASSFNGLLDRLEQAFNHQRRFMADASHELRTPITVALTATQATTSDPMRTPADLNETLHTVEEQMMRLRRIVTDMLFLSQADACSLQTCPTDMYLDDAVAEASRAAQTLARAKHQTLVVDSLPEARCMGDRDLLRQAVLVLLDNAVKFTPEGGTIQIGIRSRDNNWVCYVIDSGIGIPPDAERRIFDRFFRAVQPAGSKVPGAGLGLAIAQSIIEAHNGTLRLVQSRPGHTEFELTVPAVSPTDPEQPPQANVLAVKM
jgi:two-component system, OmpR family, sensor kinase